MATARPEVKNLDPCNVSHTAHANFIYNFISIIKDNILWILYNTHHITVPRLDSAHNNSYIITSAQVIHSVH